MSDDVEWQRDEESPVPLTRDHLQALCWEWQGILRLQDWEIEVQFKRAWDLGDGHLARISIQRQFKRAKLQMLDRVDRDPDHLFAELGEDLEHDLLHELVELHFSPFKADEGPELQAQELAINLIANALLRLKRGGGM